MRRLFHKLRAIGFKTNNTLTVGVCIFSQTIGVNCLAVEFLEEMVIILSAPLE